MYWETPILTPSQLRRLEKHKYNAQSASILDTKLQPWWNFVVSLMPMWLAPNLITMIGLCVNVLTAIMLMGYCQTATEPAPRWLTFLTGTGLFFYQTLDAIDGKQARRTGTSSPLGEIFDHGCDSVSTIFVTIASACSVSLGHHPWWLLIQCCAASALFYCAHWQTYVTGTMRFAKFDVTESQFCVMGIMFASTLFGPGFWDIQLLYLLPMRMAPTLFAAVCGGVSFAFTLDKISAGGAGKNGSTVAGTSVITPVIPLLFVMGPAVYYAVHSTQNVYLDSPIVYVITYGLIATKITNKLIVAHMSKSEMQNTDITYMVPFAFFINSYFALGISEHFLLKLAMIFVIIDVSLYSQQVCVEICNHMRLHLFKIPYGEKAS